MTYDPARDCLHECKICHYLLTHIPPCEPQQEHSYFLCPICDPDSHIRKPAPKKDAA